MITEFHQVAAQKRNRNPLFTEVEFQFKTIQKRFKAPPHLEIVFEKRKKNSTMQKIIQCMIPMFRKVFKRTLQLNSIESTIARSK